MIKKSFFVFLFLLFCLAKNFAQTELIPRKELFTDEDKRTIKFSQDGKQIGYRAEADGIMNLFVAPIENPKQAKPIFEKSDGSIFGYEWAFTKKHILYLAPKGESIHLFILNLETNEKRDLLPDEKRSVRIEKLSSDRPEEVLISLSENQQLGDFYVANFKTGDAKLVFKNDENFQSVISDSQFRPRVAQRSTGGGGYELLKQNEKGEWEKLFDVSPDDFRTNQPFAVDRRGETLFMVDNRTTDMAVLKAIDLKTNKEKILLKDEQADLVPFLMAHPVTAEIQSATSYYGNMRRHFLDASIKKDFDFLKTIHKGDVGVAGRSADDNIWLVVYFDGSIPHYYIYDRKIKKAKFLFTDHENLEKYEAAKREQIEIISRDGLKFPAHLYLPADAKFDKDKKLEKKLPLLIYVHGGPSIAYPWNSWFTNRLFQLLTNRGYAVLRVEFRGTGGFGKKILSAGNFEWGKKAQNDLLDAKNWAVKNGITDENKVGIFGWSYGGYATLAGLTFTPDEFACGIALYPISDLKALVTATQNELFMNYWRRKLGDERTEKGSALLKETSPLFAVEKIKKPLLITHGGRDTTALPYHSDKFVEAMKKYNKPVTYLYYPNEPHDYRENANWISFFAVAERFLAENLGGRFEPVGDDLNDVAFEIKAGGELIPGLMRAKNENSKQLNQ